MEDFNELASRPWKIDIKDNRVIRIFEASRPIEEQPESIAFFGYINNNHTGDRDIKNAEFAIKAINEHEQLQEENKKLKEEIEQLKEYKAMYEGLCK